MGQQSKRYKAVIADNVYTIIGSEDKEYMDMVTEIANTQLREILDLSPNTDLEQGSVLLAINAISDQIKKQERIIELEAVNKELIEKAKKVEELEARIKRFEEMEIQAKQVLKESGENVENMTPIEAQRIVNKQAIEKIQQNHQEKNTTKKE